MVTEIIVAAAFATFLSLGINRAMLVLGPRLGLMDEPGERRIHSHAIPRAGGIAIWLTFLLVIGGGLATGWLKPTGNLSWNWLGGFCAGSLVLMVAGVLDDRTGLRPLVKLGAHALAPTLFFLIHPIDTGLFPADWSSIWDFLVVLVWTVMLINAFNLIDGLDGLCGGLSAVACLSLAVLAIINGRMGYALMLFVMTGALVGFLRYNYNPARIFLGDAGSMLLGFFLATVATEAVGRRAVLGVILLPIAVAGVPLLDVLLAVWRRSSRRLIEQLKGMGVTGGIFDADSDHLHHRLLRSGGSQRKVASLLHLISVVLALLGFLPMIFGEQVYGLSLVGFMVVGMVGARNLARVEIESTGSVIHMAIKLPGSRRRMAFVLFIYDLLVLVLAGILSATIESNGFMRGASIEQLSRFVILFMILGSLATLVMRVHLRLWVRATMRDILSLQFWMLVAALATFTLFSLAYSDLEWSGLRLTVMAYVFASIGVCLPRIALDLFREIGLDARHRNPQQTPFGGFGPVVVLGAGDLGTLLLDHLKSSAHDIYPGMRVLGFLDDSKTLHGRKLRSFRILGGLSMVPDLVAKKGLQGIVLAVSNPSRDLIDELEALSLTYGLRIHHWKVGLSEGLPDADEVREEVATQEFSWSPDNRSENYPDAMARDAYP